MGCAGLDLQRFFRPSYFPSFASPAVALEPTHT